MSNDDTRSQLPNQLARPANPLFPPGAIIIECGYSEAGLLAGGDWGAAMQILPTMEEALRRAVADYQAHGTGYIVLKIVSDPGAMI